jgi:hypothetical protein
MVEVAGRRHEESLEGEVMCVGASQIGHSGLRPKRDSGASQGTTRTHHHAL